MEAVWVLLKLFGIFIMIYLVSIVYTNIELKKENEMLQRDLIQKDKIKDCLDRKIRKDAWNYKIQLKTLKDYEQLYKPNKKIKILVGDYIDSSIFNTNRVLLNLGIETDLVYSGKDIIDAVKDNEYDAIITNNVYNGSLSGPEVLKILKETLNSQIPIIILTVSEKQEKYFLDECGFDDYLVKLLDEKKAMKSLKKVIPGLKFSKIKKQ